MDKNNSAEKARLMREELKRQKAQQKLEKQKAKEQKKLDKQKEKERQEREQKKLAEKRVQEERDRQRERRRKRKIFLRRTCVVLSTLLAVACFVLMLIGEVVFTTDALYLLKIGFYVGIGSAVLSFLVFLVVAIKGETTASVAVPAWGSIALLGAMGIAVLCLGILPIGAYYHDAENGVLYAEYIDHYEAFSVDNIETVTIRNRVRDIAVQGIRKEAAAGRRKIKTLIIESTNLTIGDAAFKNCARLESVTFRGDGNVYHGFNAFENCTALKTFDLGDVRYQAAETPSEAQITTLFGTHTDAVITIHNGALLYLCDNIGTMRITGNATVMFGCTAGFGDGFTPMIGTCEFADGFDFGSSLLQECKIGFFGGLSYGAFARVLVLPASVTKIPDYLFGDLNSTCEVRYAGTQQMWDALPIGGTGNTAYQNGIIKVYCQN